MSPEAVYVTETVAPAPPVAGPIDQTVGDSTATTSSKSQAVGENKIIPVDALETLWVLALCGHQPGNLVAGELPQGGRAVPRSTAELERRQDGSPQSAYTDVNGDGRDETVIVYACDQGGVSWP